MRYFFDLVGNGQITQDIDGLECKNFEAMRARAMSILAEVAAHSTAKSDLQMLSVHVRDSAQPVYHATLTIEGAAIQG